MCWGQDHSQRSSCPVLPGQLLIPIPPKLPWPSRKLHCSDQAQKAFTHSSHCAPGSCIGMASIVLTDSSDESTDSSESLSEFHLCVCAYVCACVNSPANPEIQMELQRPQNKQTTLKTKNQIGDLAIHNSKTHHKFTLMKTVWNWQEYRHVEP